MAAGDQKKLDRKVERLAENLPGWAASAVHWLRAPEGRWVRIPAAILLIVAGFVGFLPILGFWMIPLGLLLLAQDVPFLQRPILRLIEWLERQWLALKRWWRSR
jgi:hypothetical protein